ncbi:MAG TPA: hypothetical protein VNS49_24515, partial [Streptomyces sp.]|nr:hypothetical protein [Streptomyces sp.]
LENADAGGLLALDEELAYELGASGRACWQVLAGAATGGATGSRNESRTGSRNEGGLEGRLLYDDAPYGVGYLVACWG